MHIKINEDREYIPLGNDVAGTRNENKVTELKIEVPEKYQNWNKRIVFITPDGKPWYYIKNDTFTLISEITKYGEVDAYIWLTERSESQEESVGDFRSEIFPLSFFDNENTDNYEPSPNQVDGFNGLITVLNEELEEIKTLETTIEQAEQSRANAEQDRATAEGKRETYINELKQDVQNGNLNGATFTPNVDAEGNISWSNNKQLPNPQTQNIRGPQGPTGPQGEAFQIKKTYPSIEAMQADFNNMHIGDYVMIANSVEIEDNAKLYTKTENAWVYITDFSGATGIQGPRGEQGIKGIQGEQGVGISNLEVRDGDLYVTLTNNTTQNAGTILTQEVKQWIVEQITENAKSDFNTFYNGKVDDFEDTVDDKIAEIEALNTLKIISEEVIDL